ncbi:MAG: zinc ribbon domain-containing protein [Armatimonadota bacterium]
MSTSRLYDLQQLDSAIARAIARRATLNDGTAEHAAAAGAAGRLTELRHGLADRRARLHDLELAVESVRAKRAKVEADLYSGRISNPKELAAMQEEVAILNRTTSRSEDDMLGILDEVERLEPQEREWAGTLQAADAALTRQMAAFQQATEEIEKEIADLTARREALAAELDSDLVRRYDRLRERKGGVAIVAVRAGTCEGCHVAIPERLLRRLQDDPETLAACDGCGRWLYIPPL